LHREALVNLLQRVSLHCHYGLSHEILLFESSSVAHRHTVSDVHPTDIVVRSRGLSRVPHTVVGLVNTETVRWMRSHVIFSPETLTS
jgi:hypothetical protein